jgi:hypothetical protein
MKLTSSFDGICREVEEDADFVRRVGHSGTVVVVLEVEVVRHSDDHVLFGEHSDDACDIVM